MTILWSQIQPTYSYMRKISVIREMMNLAKLEQSSSTVVFQQCHFIYPHDINYLEFIFHYLFERSQLHTLHRADFVEVLKNLIDPFDEFLAKYDWLQSDLVLSKNCNSPLENWIINQKIFMPVTK